MEKPSIERLRFCNFKLRILLNITIAINRNLPTDDLLEEYKNILSQELNIGKFLLYSKLDKDWQRMLEYGIAKSDYQRIDIQKDLLPLSTIELIIDKSESNLGIFDFVIPIFKDNEVLAYVLLGDIDNTKIGVSPSLRHFQFIQILTNVILVAIQNRKLVQKSVVQERIKQELNMAARIQSMLIPTAQEALDFECLRIKPFYMSHYEVGGDLYDFGKLSDDSIFFCIADVSGKGVSAAMIMSNFQANLRAQIETHDDMSRMIYNLNENIIKISKGEHFVTMFLAIYNFREQEIRYVNAGHLPPLVYDYGKQKLQYFNLGCPGLGMIDQIEELSIGRKKIEARTKLICFTDGLSEYAVNEQKDLGLRLTKEAIERRELNIEETVDYVVKKIDISKQNKNIFDDITMLGVEFLPQSEI